MEKHGDPTFGLHRMMAEYWGKMALRIADAPVRNPTNWMSPGRSITNARALSLSLALTPHPTTCITRQLLPFNHTDQALALRAYVEDLEALLTHKNRTLDLQPLHAAVALYQAAAAAVEEECAAASLKLQLQPQPQLQSASGSSSNPGREMAERINDRLAFAERRFLSPRGLPGRMWFRHVGQAPGLYMGYGAESLPGVTQAVNDGRMLLAQEQVLVAAGRFTDAALFLAGREGEERPPGAEDVAVETQ